MKKYVLVLGVFCFFAGSLQAQKNITPGIKGGLNIADLSGLNGDNRLSGHLGFFINSKLNKNWAIQPEILYSGQGQQYHVGNDEHTIALNYIQVPIMFQFYPIKEFYIDFGPQIGFLIAANDKNGDDKVEADSYYKKADIGLSFGAGYQVTQLLGFYGRYNAGLSDVAKSNVDFFNRVGQLGIYIKFK